MKEKRFSPFAVILLCLATLTVLAGAHQHRAQFVFIRGIRYEKICDELDLSGTPAVDLEELKQLPGLRRLDMRGSRLTPAEYDELCRWLPECRILWDIPFQGQLYGQDTRELTVTELSDGDIAALAYFPELKRIQAHDCSDYAQLRKLQDQQPDLEVNYFIRYNGVSYSRQLTQLTIPGDTPEALAEVLPYFDSLQSVTLTAPLAPMDRILALREAFPDITFTWKFHIRGVSVDEFTEKLDLTGRSITVEEMEALLPYLPNLNWLDLSYCGNLYEDLEQMDQRYEDIRVVWTVILGRWFSLRTDVTSFMPVKDGFYPRGNDLENLKYCHDIIAMDLGHMKISNCDFVAYMPKLQYLVLADTPISDLTPLTGLQELIYLEVFLTDVTDFSPLLTIPTLQDLNMCYTAGDPEIISQMTWLKNLWWTNCRNMQMVQQGLTETHLEFFTHSSTGNGWRELPNYYAQRDIFGMGYMKG